MTVTTVQLTNSASVEELTGLVQLINDVYDVAESGMWKTTGFRTAIKEVQDLAASQHLLVAREEDTRIICGSVKIEEIDKTTGGFGMLVVDPEQRGKGIGGKLVRAAEEWARENGYKEMQLELLTPKTWKQPSKEFNKGWYARLGYIPQKTEAFADEFPQLIPLMATECDFTIWRKPLLSSNMVCSIASSNVVHHSS